MVAEHYIKEWTTRQDWAIHTTAAACDSINIEHVSLVYPVTMMTGSNAIGALKSELFSFFHISAKDTAVGWITFNLFNM